MIQLNEINNLLPTGSRWSETVSNRLDCTRWLANASRVEFQFSRFKNFSLSLANQFHKLCSYQNFRQLELKARVHVLKPLTKHVEGSSQLDWDPCSRLD